jgi:Family of unknown function (DUF5994)
MKNDLQPGELAVDDQSGPRLRVTNRLPSEHIDGAWWPRSTDLPGELPTLLSALSDRLGRIVVVGYRRDGWPSAPTEVDIAGDTVELLGFDSAEPASVVVIGHDGRHLTLRVIPPGTGEPVARQALDAIPERSGDDARRRQGSAVARSVTDVADGLARHEGRGDDHRSAEILRWCEQAADQFVAARIQTFVPILVELQTRPAVQTRAGGPDPGRRSRPGRRAQTQRGCEGLWTPDPRAYGAGA